MSMSSRDNTMFSSFVSLTTYPMTHKDNTDTQATPSIHPITMNLQNAPASLSMKQGFLNGLRLFVAFFNLFFDALLSDLMLAFSVISLLSASTLFICFYLSSLLIFIILLPVYILFVCLCLCLFIYSTIYKSSGYSSILLMSGLNPSVKPKPYIQTISPVSACFRQGTFRLSLAIIGISL